MKPTKEQIDNWIEIGLSDSSGNKIIDFSIDDFLSDPLKYYKRFIMEMFVQIERWDLLVENVFINPLMLNKFTSLLGDVVEFQVNPNYDNDQIITIWGCPLVPCEYVPEDILIGYNSVSVDYQGDPISDGRNIVIGKLELKTIDRINKIKAFW